MVLKLGLAIMKAVKKSYPVLRSGASAMPEGLRFDLKNPYILEVLPEKQFAGLQKLEGKKLNTVCRVLGRDDFPLLLNRYERLSLKGGFREDEFQKLYQKAFPSGKVPTDTNLDAFVFLNDLKPEIGAKFDAHGLAKVSVTDQLRQLNTLLTKGIDKEKSFFTAPLSCDPKLGSGLGTGGGHAYRDGSFIIVSGKGKTICSDGIEHVIVNDAYYPVIEDLRNRFPNVNFVRADEAVEYFSRL